MVPAPVPPEVVGGIRGDPDGTPGVRDCCGFGLCVMMPLIADTVGYVWIKSIPCSWIALKCLLNQEHGII